MEREARDLAKHHAVMIHIAWFSFAAKNGCYRAKRPASKSCDVDFDAQHAHDRHWLPRESMKGGTVPKI